MATAAGRRARERRRLAMGPRGAKDAPDRVKVVDGFRTQTSMTLHVLESLQLVSADASTAVCCGSMLRRGRRASGGASVPELPPLRPADDF